MKSSPSPSEASHPRSPSGRKGSLPGALLSESARPLRHWHPLPFLTFSFLLERSDASTEERLEHWMARDLWLGLCGGQLAPPCPLPLGPPLCFILSDPPSPLPHSDTSWSLGVLSALHWPPICPARSSPLSRYLGEWPSWDPGRVTDGQIDRQMSRVMKGAGEPGRSAAQGLGILVPDGACRLCVPTCPQWAPMTMPRSHALRDPYDPHGLHRSNMAPHNSPQLPTTRPPAPRAPQGSTIPAGTQDSPGPPQPPKLFTR